MMSRLEQVTRTGVGDFRISLLLIRDHNFNFILMAEMDFTAKDRIRLVTGGQLRCPHTRPTSSMRIQSRDGWNSLGGWINTRCRAAIRAMGQYGQVIPLNRNRE